MIDYFKVEKSSLNKNEYTISPTSNYLKIIFEDNDNWAKSNIMYISKEFNYTLENFFKYLIADYEAKIYPIENFPYFLINFNKKYQAESFCKELNSRCQKKYC